MAVVGKQGESRVIDGGYEADRALPRRLALAIGPQRRESEGGGLPRQILGPRDEEDLAAAPQCGDRRLVQISGDEDALGFGRSPGPGVNPEVPVILEGRPLDPDDESIGGRRWKSSGFDLQIAYPLQTDRHVSR